MGRSNVEVIADKCSLYSNYSVQLSSLFGVGTAFPHLFIKHYTLAHDHFNQLCSNEGKIIPA